MRIIDKWPTKAKKLSLTDRTEPLLDGRIYEFTLDDAAKWGIQIVCDSEHLSDEDNAKNTKYYRSRALTTLMNKIRGATLKLEGPYQTRFLLEGETLLFQFTGLRDCRLNTCDEMAVEGGKGYCDGHYEMKLKEGKVS